MIPFGTLGDGQSLGAAPLPGQYLPIGQELQTATPLTVVFKYKLEAHGPEGIGTQEFPKDSSSICVCDLQFTCVLQYAFEGQGAQVMGSSRAPPQLNFDVPPPQ